MKSITVYCGANKGFHPAYEEAAKELGTYLAENGYTMIFGGGSVGLMGVTATAALEAGGKVIGVIPHFLDAMEVGHKELTEMHLVDTMHTRKAKMEELSDAFITMPGGYGSMDEIFEILTWAQLGLHKKPVGILNIRGYYDLLIKQLDHMVEEGFLRKENRELIVVGDDIPSLFEAMHHYEPDVRKKWLDNSGI